MAKHPCIVFNSDNAVLVSASSDKAISLEGNWYFHPDCIDMDRFEISDRLYSCPKKGVCNWVDLKIDKGFWNDISWIYATPKKEYQHIAGWYGFYPEHKLYHYEECED